MAMVTVSDWFLGIQQQSCRPGGGGGDSMPCSGHASICRISHSLALPPTCVL
jgi:hypothetical protein